MPTQATVLARIRSQVNETTARFFSNDDLMNWYSDGAAQQHRVALEMARQGRKLQDVSHPYLKKYGKMTQINVVAGTAFYALPTDFLMEVNVTLLDVGGLVERDAMRYTGHDDWMVENIPHLRPTFVRPAYSFRINPATGIGAIRLYAFGDQGVPNQAGAIRLYYLREFTRITSYVGATSTDVDDPYNEGPIWYAVGQGKMKRGEDPSGFLALAERCAQNIMGPIAAASATGQKAQGEGAAMAVEAGENRDTR